MNKNGFVFLIICGVAFIIAIFAFYGTVGDQTPGWGEKVLGEAEIEVFELYQTAEKDLFYIEQSARVAGQQASATAFEAEFKESFALYINLSNLSIDDYTFAFDEDGDTMTIIGYASERWEYDHNYLRYAITPNFKVTVAYEAPEEEGFIEED